MVTCYLRNQGTNETTHQGEGAKIVANTIPEFLYQLTKLLTDDNRDAIEWNYGKRVLIDVSRFVGL